MVEIAAQLPGRTDHAARNRTRLQFLAQRGAVVGVPSATSGYDELLRCAPNPPYQPLQTALPRARATPPAISLHPSCNRLPGAPSAATGAGAAAAGVAAAVGPRAAAAAGARHSSPVVPGGRRTHLPQVLAHPSAQRTATHRTATNKPATSPRRRRRQRFRSPPPPSSLTARSRCTVSLRVGTTNSRVTTMGKECRPAAAAARRRRRRGDRGVATSGAARRAPRAAAARRAAAVWLRRRRLSTPRRRRRNTASRAGVRGYTGPTTSSDRTSWLREHRARRLRTGVPARGGGDVASRRLRPTLPVRGGAERTRGGSGDASTVQPVWASPAAMRGLNTLKSHHKCGRS